jgi:pilus assembly protein Flp/PilA
MLNYIRSIQKRRAEETGASAVEYGLLVALIAAVIVVAVVALGGLVKSAFDETCGKIQQKNDTATECTAPAE